MATYTFTSLNCASAVTLSVGNKKTERAANPATKRATVVKKPKTACARLSAEYMLVPGMFGSALPGYGRG